MEPQRAKRTRLAPVLILCQLPGGGNVRPATRETINQNFPVIITRPIPLLFMAQRGVVHGVPTPRCHEGQVGQRALPELFIFSTTSMGGIPVARVARRQKPSENKSPPSVGSKNSGGAASATPGRTARYNGILGTLTTGFWVGQAFHSKYTCVNLRTSPSEHTAMSGLIVGGMSGRDGRPG